MPVEKSSRIHAKDVDVTIQVLSDYRQLLYDSGVCMQ